jgi:hypothetical protein
MTMTSHHLTRHPSMRSSPITSNFQLELRLHLFLLAFLRFHTPIRRLRLVVMLS